METLELLNNFSCTTNTVDKPGATLCETKITVDGDGVEIRNVYRNANGNKIAETIEYGAVGKHYEEEQIVMIQLYDGKRVVIDMDAKSYYSTDAQLEQLLIKKNPMAAIPFIGGSYVNKIYHQVSKKLLCITEVNIEQTKLHVLFTTKETYFNHATGEIVSERTFVEEGDILQLIDMEYALEVELIGGKKKYYDIASGWFVPQIPMHKPEDKLFLEIGIDLENFDPFKTSTIVNLSEFLTKMAKTLHPEFDYEDDLTGWRWDSVAPLKSTKKLEYESAIGNDESHHLYNLWVYCPEPNSVTAIARHDKLDFTSQDVIFFEFQTKHLPGNFVLKGMWSGSKNLNPVRNNFSVYVEATYEFKKPIMECFRKNIALLKSV